MKKYILIISLFLILCGCGKGNDSIKNKFINKIDKVDSYVLKGNMEIISNEDTFKYDVVASKSKDGFYKVSLVNKTNDHEQVILKNNDGVYVVTPDLNKSFKFQSDWPNNGSQSYLLDILANDIKNDNNVHVGKDKYNYIQCRVNYPNNNTLYSEKIYLDDKYNVKIVEVLDQDNNVKISLKVNNIDYKTKFDGDYFKLESLIDIDDNSSNKTSDINKDIKKEDNVEDKDKNEIKENQNVEKDRNNEENNLEENNNNDDKTNEDKEENTSNILDDIIYPLYIPVNTHLNTKDTINTEDGTRAILTFSGDSPFILVEETSKVYDELEIIPVNGDPIMMNDSIGAISNNSLYWTSNGIDYYLSSNSIDSNELMTIAEGLTGTSIIVSAEK